MTATSRPPGITSQPSGARCAGPTAEGRCISCPASGRRRSLFLAGWLAVIVASGVLAISFDRQLAGLERLIAAADQRLDQHEKLIGALAALLPILD